MVDSFSWESCSCFELGYQICSHYEAYCSEQESNEWWLSLTQEERDSFELRICEECTRVFDDNPMKNVCKTCEEWVSVYMEDGINF